MMPGWRTLIRVLGELATEMAESKSTTSGDLLESNGVSAYEDHERRLTEDSAYREGFAHGLAGHEADNYPDDPTEANAWGAGWRIGIAAHRMQTLTEDLTKAVAQAIQATTLRP